MLRVEMTIVEYLQDLQAGEFSVREGVEFFLKEIAKRDLAIGAYLEVWEKEALEEANKADKKIKVGEKLRPLEGVPVALKDNILVEGRTATAGSKMLADYKAEYDAAVVEKLRAAGAIFLGRTNMDEFAFGSSTEQSAWQVTRNPADLERVPGGTSGGSAAAVAAGLAVAGLGTDTGGSVRQPASFCGVVGLRPTYGAVSRYGVVAAASSFDQVSPIGKTAEDTALLWQVIAGKDERDSTSRDFDYKSELAYSDKPENMTLGVPKEWLERSGDFKGVDERTKLEMRMAREKLEKIGVKFKEVSLGQGDRLLACYYISIFAEESSNLSRFDGLRYSPVKGINPQTLENLYVESRSAGFGPESKRRIILGNFVLSSGFYDAYYSQAQKVRQLIREEVQKALGEVDALFIPTAPTVAFKIGEKTDDPLAMYYGDLFTVLASLTGSPSLSVPSEPYGTERKGLPVGWQIIGRDGGERELLSLAHIYEQSFKK